MPEKRGPKGAIGAYKSQHAVRNVAQREANQTGCSMVLFRQRNGRWSWCFVSDWAIYGNVFNVDTTTEREIINPEGFNGDDND